ncbi:MAG TPA: hypothetical protein VK858_20515 [Longimicrobiales bacterium]|nr:hypothetical protein [Longimicrobiales bacterium]
MALPTRQYSEKELSRIRTRSKAVGWIQGGATVFLGGLLLRMIGWIPAVLIVVVVGYVVYKLLGGGGEDEG